MTIDINSPHNPRVKRAAKLRTPRGRKQHQRILIEGTRELRRALEANVEAAIAALLPWVAVGAFCWRNAWQPRLDGEAAPLGWFGIAVIGGQGKARAKNSQADDYSRKTPGLNRLCRI